MAESIADNSESCQAKGLALSYSRRPGLAVHDALLMPTKHSGSARLLNAPQGF